MPNVKYSGVLTYPDPFGPSRRPVVGDLYIYIYIYIYISNNTGILCSGFCSDIELDSKVISFVTSAVNRPELEADETGMH